MKSTGPIKHVFFAFIIAVALYFTGYHGIEHLRTHKGPWQVTFTTDAAGVPELIINQPALGIADLVIRFTNRAGAVSNAHTVLTFDQARTVPYAVPFGKCIFQDATFLPGTATFNLLGHEIELIPRVLYIDRKEHPWQSGVTIELTQPGVYEPKEPDAAAGVSPTE